ncbi:YhgE/Pip domain-containing protein [Anaerotardibacter muris]|uniref:YhgE/Pip domain-containing protein n=1 Tax=Anaerotardibacter muris TaxID=2941505 RepID=UPI00203CFE35|nr:YhgE/Pip domain-containing protein [Anaerotardibacter muris]
MKKLREHISLILQIFKRDMKRLVVNPIACLIVAGACVLPALYAWYTIAAFWDPYHNTESIQVAVVDNDKGAHSELAGDVNIGHEVVEDLSKNHQLGWQIVDEQQAMDGVHSGEYYAAIILPEDFSSSYLSVLDGHFERPKIDLYVNDEQTASGVKVAEAGASALEKSINEQFVSSVSEKVIAVFKRSGAELMNDTDEANGSLTQGVNEANAAIASTVDTLQGLDPTLDSASVTAAEAKDALSNVKTELPGLEARLLSAKEQVKAVQDSLNAYTASVSDEVTKASLEMGLAAAKASASAGQISGKLEAVAGSVDASISELQRVVDLNAALLSDLRAQAAAGTPGLESAITTLEQENAELSSTLVSLRDLSESLSSATSSTEASIQDIANAVEASSAALREATANIHENVLPKLNASLDDMAAAIGVIRGALISLEPVIDESITVTEGLHETLARAKDICASAQGSLQQIKDGLDSALTDLRALQESATYQLLAAHLNVSDDKLAQFLAEPVEMHTNDIFPVANYGSGVAPFFTNLALWVAGFILMAIVRIRVDPTGLPKFSRVDAYFGRWLTYVVLGAIMGAVVTIGDLVIGVSCVSPPAFILAGVLTAFVYVNLMYALAYSMRHLGKAIAVFLLILQIPGSSGMFPVEMLPEFYQVLNPLLPFTYSIDAMREALAGFYGLDYLFDMLMLLLVFLPVGFIIGLVAGKYGYNLNILFDRELGTTDVFTSEKSGDLKPAFRLRTMVRALLDTSQYREFIIDRAKRFDHNYNKLARIGWFALFAMPVLMIVCISLFQGGPDAKLIMLAWFFLALLAVAIYLICISFLKSSIEYQMALAQKSDEDIKTSLSQARAESKLPPALGDASDDLREGGDAS